MVAHEKIAGYTVGSASQLGVDSDAVAHFYASNWQRRIALELPSFYRWQFVAAPASFGADHCCVAIDEKGNILGVMGLNPRPFILRGKVEKAAELTTWVVSESARGMGIGRRILEFLQKEYDVLFGSGITQAAMPLYRGAGFRHIRSLPRFVKVFRSDLPAEFVKANKFGQTLLQRPPAHKNTKKLKSRRIDAQQAASVADKALSTRNHFLRDDAHLKWRYESHPVFQYQLLAIGDGSNQSVVVLRTDNINGVAIGHIVECFSDEKELPATIQFIEDFCADHKIDLIDFTCTVGAIAGHFLARGWFSTLDDEEVQVSNLFYPPEVRTPPTTSIVLWTRGESASLFDFGKLYVTKGDLDLDRPTIAYYQTKGLA